MNIEQSQRQHRQSNLTNAQPQKNTYLTSPKRVGAFTGQQTQNFDKSADRQPNIFQKSRPSNNTAASFQNQPQKEQSKGMIGQQVYSDQKIPVVAKLGVRRAQVSIERKSQNVAVGLSNNAKKQQNDKRSDDQDQTHLKSSRIHAYENQNARMNEKSLSNRGDSHNIDILNKQNKNSQTQQVGQQKLTNIINPLSRFNINEQTGKDLIHVQNCEFTSQKDNFDDQNIVQYSLNVSSFQKQNLIKFGQQINRNLNSQKKQSNLINKKSGNYTRTKKATENVQAQRHQQHYLQMRNNQNMNKSLNQSITSQGSTKDYGKHLQSNDSLAILSKQNVYIKNNQDNKLPFKNDGNSNASETSIGARVVEKSKQIAQSTSPLKTGHRQSQIVVPSKKPIEITDEMHQTFDLVQASSPIFAQLKQGSLTAKKSIVQQPISYYNQQNQQKYFLNQKSINVKQQDSLGSILNLQSKNHYLKIQDLGRQFEEKSLSKSQLAMEIGDKSQNDYGNKERDTSVNKQAQIFNMQRIFKSKSPSKKSIQLQQILRSINLINSQKNSMQNRNTQSKNLKKSFISQITAQDMKNSTQKSSSLIRNFINQISNQMSHNHTKSHQNINALNSGRNSRVDNSQQKQKINQSFGNQSFISCLNPNNQLNKSNSNIQLQHKNNKHINPYIQAKNRQGSSNITGKGNQISNSNSQTKIMIIKESNIQLHNINYQEIKNYTNEKINLDIKHVEDNALQKSQKFQIGAISVGEYVLQTKPKNQAEHNLSLSLKNKLENTLNQNQKQNPIQLHNFVNSENDQRNQEKLKSLVTDRSDNQDGGSSTQRLLKKDKFLVGAFQIDSAKKQNMNQKQVDKNSARKNNNQKYISHAKVNNQNLYFNKNNSHFDKNLIKPLFKKETELQNEQKSMDGPSDLMNKLQKSSSQCNTMDQFNQTIEKKNNFQNEFVKKEQQKTEKFSENIDEIIAQGNPVITPKMVSEMSASNLKSSMTAKLANKQKNRNNQVSQTLQKNVSGNLIKKETKYMAISFSSDNFVEENEQSPTNEQKNEDINNINAPKNYKEEQLQVIEDNTLLLEQDTQNQIQIDKVNINLKYLTQLSMNNQVNDINAQKNIIYENPYKDQMEEKNVSNEKLPLKNENVLSQNNSTEKKIETPVSSSSISAKNEHIQKSAFFENQKQSDQYYTSQITAKLPELEMKLSSSSSKYQNFDDKKIEKSQSVTRNSMIQNNSQESLEDAFPLSHDIFLEVFQDILLEEEILEIGLGENQFQNIYFAGTIPFRNPDKLEQLKLQNIQKIKEFNKKQAEQEAESNNGEFQGNPIFDNSEGYYKVQIGDHLAYRYEIIKVLGKGSFAQVVQCRDHKMPGKPLYAVKITRNTEMDHKFAHKEAQYLKYIMQEDPQDKHNIVRMFDQTFFREHHCFVFELLHTDLFEHLKATGFVGFSTDKIRDYALQILKALVFLEKHKIIHCDLKPENILCADNQCRNLKMVDFGSGCFRDEQIYTYVQSRFYRSPEVIMRIKYSEKVDIWSLGCIVAELYTGEPIFPGNNEQEQIELIMELCGMPPESMIDKSRKKEYYFDSDYSPFLIEDEQLGILRIPNSRTIKDAVPSEDELFLDFVIKCLEIDPERRFSASEAMEHPWIKAALRESLLKGKIIQQQIQDQRQNPIKRRTQQESISDDLQLLQPQIIRDKESFVREREGQEAPAEYSPERDIIVQRKTQKPNKETAFGIKLNNANNESFQNSGSNGKRKQINIYGTQAQNEEGKQVSGASKGVSSKEIKVSQFIADQKIQQSKLSNNFVNTSNVTDSKNNQPTMFQKQNEILKKNINLKQEYEMISQQRNLLILKTKISNIDFQQKLQAEDNEILNPIEPLDISENEIFDFQKYKIEQIDKYRILKGANTNKASSNQNNIFQMQQFSQKKNISTIKKEDQLINCNVFLSKSIIPDIDFTNKYVRRGVQGQNSSFIVNNQGGNINCQSEMSKNIGQIQDSVDNISEIQNVVSKASQVLNSQSNQSPLMNKYGHGQILESQFSPQVAHLSQMEQISQFLEDDEVEKNYSQDFNFQEESQIQESGETHRIQQLLNIATSPARRAGGDSMVQGAEQQVQDHQIRYSVAQVNSPAIKKKKVQSKNYLLPSQ